MSASVSWSWLPPGTEIAGCAANQAGARCTAMEESAQPHVHRCRLRIPHALAAGKELLERVGQELVCRDILSTSQQLTGSNLIQNRGHFVVRGPRIDHVAFE